MPVHSKINPDLQEERNKVLFKVDEFTKWYYGGSSKVQEKKFYEHYFLSDPELQSNVDLSYLSHKEKYEEAIRRSTIVMKKIKKLQSEGRGGTDLYSKIMNGVVMSGVLKEANPFVTHLGMFLPSLINLGTDAQQKEWVDRAWNCEVIGTYAQTELGHGTFIRGIETTAIFDPRRREFVIHSPTIRAYKWWPGGLAHTCNHAVVFAQLYTKTKCYGVHPFIVQLRDFETHMPMKGITIGEVGNKVGFNCTNNGFLGFNNVRIPLKNMLMKNAQVLPDGNYVKGKSSVLTYGIMTLVRVTILRDQAAALSKAVTIAMRYATVRRQSPIDPNQPEPKIIEHVTQQMKIFPAIAKVLVFKLSADTLARLHNEVTAEIEMGKLERLPELHAISCCLKSVFTDETVKSVQTLRLACGGHGYLNSSGFNDIYGSTTAAQAYEGENTVLYLQTARFLIKAWTQALEGGSLTPTVAYLKRFVDLKGKRGQWNDSVNGILNAFQTTAAGCVQTAFNRLEERKKTMSHEEAANLTGIELARAAEIHCQVFLLNSAMEMLTKSANETSSELGAALLDILDLFAVDLALRYLGNILLYVDATSSDIERLQSRLETSLKKLMPNAIGIVDGFDHPDAVLVSTLGAYDGNVYERLLEAAKKSPLNQEDVNKSFHMHLKPFMNSNL